MQRNDDNYSEITGIKKLTLTAGQTSKGFSLDSHTNCVVIQNNKGSLSHVGGGVKLTFDERVPRLIQGSQDPWFEIRTSTLFQSKDKEAIFTLIFLKVE